MNTKKETGATPEKSEVAKREEAMLEYWREHDVFNKSLERPGDRELKGDYVFYDGPPFATGLPHYGHILAGTIKDAIPRFWTMQGYRVRRKWGWDCHGLPLENLIEKRLGLATKRDIEDYGVQNFNEAARDAVLEFRDDWKRIIPRMGRFADMDDDYRTMDSTYTESVWWVFKTLHEKGLVYEGFKSMHLCPRCGTTLSNFEVNQGYKDVKDIAVTVKLPLLDEAGNQTDTSLLVWTTTPWTLPGNMAAAVHGEADYVVAEISDKKDRPSDMGSDGSYVVKDVTFVKVIVAKENFEKVVSRLDWNIHSTKEIKGSELVGKRYMPPFDYWTVQEFENKENAWQIFHADYVELGDEGTGAVHLAPAYGDEDMELAKVMNIPIVHHVDEAGHFKDFVTDFAGQLVKPKDDDESGVSHLDADIEIVKALKQSGKLFKKENITHSYPHCWRCDTPLLNYATTSWFVEVTKIRDELVAANEKVHWVPEHVGKNRFGKWLENARDWAVSRQRYWGAPLPIWRNPETKEYKVFGSLAELQEYVPKSGNVYTLIRHGEAESNIKKVICADVNSPDPLTEQGIQQTKAAASQLKEKNIDIIITSPFQRTKETAEILRSELGLSEEALIIDDRLQELQAGSELEGKKWADYSAYFANDEERFTKIVPGVENRRDLQKRTGELLFEVENKYQGKNILFVGHMGSLNALRSAAIGADWKQAMEVRREQPIKNADIIDMPFAPYPRNDNYVLDYHRPYIDNVVLKENGVQLERVPDVFDCWFESGSMPYAETHYPFENLDVADMEKGVRFPADFISEAVDQTRGWFYSLMVLGVALFGKAPYQHVITNGLVLAEDGKKMSKKLQNYPDPVELVDRQGADSMRFYLLSSPIIKGEDLNFSEKEVQELQRKNIGRLHNVLAMYEQYENGDEAHTDSDNNLDRWIIARLNELVGETTAGYKNYELDRATRPITDFIDDLSAWYLRRSRDRLKSDDAVDKANALATLRHVLKSLTLVMAPAMPFYAEYLWSRVKEERDVESVHLAAWPEMQKPDLNIVAQMEAARLVVSKALEVRAKNNIKIRQPLSKLAYAKFEEDDLTELHKVIADEVNVKEVIESKNVNGVDIVDLDITITPELQAEGDAREFMRQVQDLRKKTGLTPHDRIAITIQTSDGGEAVVKTHESDIKKTVGAESIIFGDAVGTEIIAGEHSFTVAIQKV